MRPLTFKIENVRAAIPSRLPGYWEACMARGQISDDGKTITFTYSDWKELRRIFNPTNVNLTPKKGCC